MWVKKGKGEDKLNVRAVVSQWIGPSLQMSYGHRILWPNGSVTDERGVRFGVEDTWDVTIEGEEGIEAGEMVSQSSDKEDSNSGAPASSSLEKPTTTTPMAIMTSPSESPTSRTPESTPAAPQTVQCKFQNVVPSGELDQPADSQRTPHCSSRAMKPSQKTQDLLGGRGVQSARKADGVLFTSRDEGGDALEEASAATTPDYSHHYDAIFKYDIVLAAQNIILANMIEEAKRSDQWSLWKPGF